MNEEYPAHYTHPLIRKALEKTVPIADLIGFSLKEIGQGRAVGAFQAGPQHANPMGTLHGGVLCDISDAAMGLAFASTLTEDESFTTVDLQIHFFRPVRNGQLRSEAHVVERGKTIGYIECGITDEGGKLVAKASSTCMILRGDKATGR
jgi:uncharacterized protein (TIGR00369 family)